MKILLTGATGFIGRALAPALVADGHELLAGTRFPDRYQGPGKPVKVDLSDPVSLKATVQDCDAVYYLVHSMESPDFVEQDRRAAHALVAAVADQHTRIIYLGALGDQKEAAKHSAHLGSRHEVGAILRAAPDTVELRAAIVLGAGSAGFEILRQLVDRLPVMICPSWVSTRCQPIAAADMVKYLLVALHLPTGSYDVGGADVVTYEHMMKRYAARSGHRRLILKVPIFSPRLSSHWIGVITDQNAALARPLAEGLAVEVVVMDRTIMALTDFEPMGFEDALTAALATRRVADKDEDHTGPRSM